MNKQIEDEGLTCAYLLGKSEGYQQGKADQKKEDNEFFNFDKVLEIEKNESYQQGAREFATWLANGCAFMRRLGEDDMHTVDELISEWQKGAIRNDA